MRKTVRLTGFLLAVVMAFSVFTVSKLPASAAHLGILRPLQTSSHWGGSAHTYGGGTLQRTGCGIFALVNAVGYATGKRMNIDSVAKWAHSIGAYNQGSSANGTVRGVLYPKVQAKYGSSFGFKVNCNGGSGFWASSSSATLKNHLKSHNNAAVCHVPGHFIALVDWNGSKYRVYDSAPSSSRPTGNGDCWKTPSQLTVGKLKLDWFCLITPTGSSASIPKLDKSTAGTYKCTATQLNVRSGPGTSYGILGSLKSGDKIKIVGTRGIWAQFTFNGKTAYASTKYLTKVTAPPPPPQPPTMPDLDTSTAGKYRVIANQLNVRSGPSTDYKILGVLNQGDVITAVGTRGGWAQFTFNGQTAYASAGASYMEKVVAPPPPPSPPSPPSPPPAGEAANVALSATYKGSSNSATNGTGSYGDGDSWKSYHTGKLNDGTIIKVATNNTDKGTVEMCVNDISNIQTGSYRVIYKLAASTAVSSVKVLLNNRTGVTYRGYPDKVEAFVGSGEDVSSATSIGSQSSYSVYEGSETARLCSIASSSAVTGQYVIIQFTINDVNKGVNDVSEIQIWSAAAPTPPANAENVARGASYKGLNSATNTGSYSDGDNWTGYHTGKLNDGIIIKIGANGNDKGTVEMCAGTSIGAAKKGSYDVIFNLGTPISIASVKVFLNDRPGSNLRGYPAKVEAFVGSSESAANSIGSMTSYPAYDGSETAKLCEITASSAVTGQYVVIRFTVDDASKVVNDVSEIEIWSAAAAPPPPPPAPPEPPVATPVASAPVLGFSGGTQTTDGYRLQQNTALTVSWAAVANATSYKYKVEKYDGEIGGTVPTVLLDTSTTGTSFTVPAQTSGKYYRIVVSAVSSNEMPSEPAIITLISSQSSSGGIPISKLNEVDSNGANAIFSDFIATNMTFQFWRGFLLAPNADGTYIVSEVYEYNVAKDPTIFETSGGDLILMVYSNADGYDIAEDIVAGDRITLNGIYIDQNKLEAGANVTVNGETQALPPVGDVIIEAPEEIYYGEDVGIEWSAPNALTYDYKITKSGTTLLQETNVTARGVTIPAQTDGTAIAVTVTAKNSGTATKTKTITIGLTELVPDDITSNPDSGLVKRDDDFRGMPANTTKEVAVAYFEQTSEYLEFYKSDGVTPLGNNDLITTGCIVQLVNVKVTVSYMLIVVGDITGGSEGDSDGLITDADYVAQKSSLKGVTALEGASNDAADINGDGIISALDIAALKASISN